MEGGALTALGMTAGIIGLMVITIERYFKIVHAIAHRKYYHNWMTSVGVALPWIGGSSLILFPGMATTRIADGRCQRLTFWPNEAMALVSHAFHDGATNMYHRKLAICQENVDPR